MSCLIARPIISELNLGMHLLFPKLQWNPSSSNNETEIRFLFMVETYTALLSLRVKPLSTTKVSDPTASTLAYSDLSL